MKMTNEVMMMAARVLKQGCLERRDQCKTGECVLDGFCGQPVGLWPVQPDDVDTRSLIYIPKAIKNTVVCRGTDGELEIRTCANRVEAIEEAKRLR